MQYKILHCGLSPLSLLRPHTEWSTIAAQWALATASLKFKIQEKTNAIFTNCTSLTRWFKHYRKESHSFKHNWRCKAQQPYPVFSLRSRYELTEAIIPGQWSTGLKKTGGRGRLISYCCCVQLCSSWLGWASRLTMALCLSTQCRSVTVIDIFWTQQHQNADSQITTLNTLQSPNDDFKMSYFQTC